MVHMVHMLCCSLPSFVFAVSIETMVLQVDAETTVGLIKSQVVADTSIEVEDMMLVLPSSHADGVAPLLLNDDNCSLRSVGIVTAAMLLLITPLVVQVFVQQKPGACLSHTCYNCFVSGKLCSVVACVVMVVIEG